MGLQFQLLYTEFDRNSESMQQKVVSAICMDMFPNVYLWSRAARTRVFKMDIRFQCYQPTQNHFQNLKSDACTYVYVLVPSTICRSINFNTAKPDALRTPC